MKLHVTLLEFCWKYRELLLFITFLNETTIHQKKALVAITTGKISANSQSTFSDIHVPNNILAAMQMIINGYTLNYSVGRPFISVHLTVTSVIQPEIAKLLKV